MTRQLRLSRRPYTRLCSSVLFPVHELVKRHDSVTRRRALEQSQWWSPERLDQHRVERLRDFLCRVGATVPYYEAVFRCCGFDPAGVTAVADLAALPLLTKATIRAETAALTARDAPRLRRLATGGSSEPLIFFAGRERISHDVAAKWRATRWWGVDIGDPEVVLWGSPIELGAQDRLRSWRDRALRSTLLSAFDTSARGLDSVVATIRARRPAMLFGYPSALALLARHVERQGTRVDDVGVRVAFVTGEKLEPEDRDRIARSFGCPVADGYGGRDSGFLAHECPSGGMHLSAEDVVVEIVDAGGNPVPPGVAGEVVVTHLASSAFPFIRYRNGDVAVRDTGSCPCGRGLPLLREIRGRAGGFVVRRDGTLLHGTALRYVVRDVPGIARYKVVQESIDRTRVLLVVEPGFDAADIARIGDGIARRLGPGAGVEVELVAEIATQPSGKYESVVSKVPRP